MLVIPKIFISVNKTLKFIALSRPALTLNFILQRDIENKENM